MGPMRLTMTLCSWAVLFSALLVSQPLTLQSETSHLPKTGVAFMVNGDWGGKPRKPFTTQAQVHVASALGRQAGQIGAKFTLLLGDNFYLDGVRSVDDPRFLHTFENVFTSEHLQSDRHFRVIAGNHDHNGKVTAQIAYSAKSPRWFFPKEYYDFEERAVGSDGKTFSVHFVMIDTVILTEGRPLEAERHWAWLAKTLNNSSADFLVVAGHYPVWSTGGSHGSDMYLVQHLRPLLEAANVSVYLAGHDHIAEHIDEGSSVQYHVVGAGHGFSSGRRVLGGLGSIPRKALKWYHDPHGSAHA